MALFQENTTCIYEYLLIINIIVNFRYMQVNYEWCKLKIYFFFSFFFLSVGWPS